jgi:hypothetical protein
MHQTDATLAATELSKNKKPQNKAIRFVLRSQPYELKLNQRRWVGFKSCRLLAPHLLHLLLKPRWFLGEASSPILSGTELVVNSVS